jgi:phosphatidate cytidylyltransferase
VIRIATAIIGVPAILALIYVAPPAGFYALTLVAGLIGTWELLGMTHAGDTGSRVLGVLVSAAVSLAIYFGGHDPRVAMTALIAVPLAGPLLTLFRLGDVRTAALRACAMGFAPLFAGLPLTLLALMRRDLPMGGHYVILAIGFAWLGDTGGYFAGRFLGKHKLYEAVSPKKTVEGAIGSLLGSIGWAILVHFLFLHELPLTHAIPLAVVAGALGQAGDLGESVIKRSTGVKDSGQIVPGHGGILDRVDALILTSAVVYLYTLWVNPLRP